MTGPVGLTWSLHGDGRTIGADDIVRPDERLSWPRTIGFGGQHVVAMFGATFLVTILTGFPPSTTLFFSGIGTLLFLPAAAWWALGEPSRAGTAGLIVVGLVLPVLVLRLEQIWQAAPGA